MLALIQPIYADYQSGLDAYNALRYTTALDEWTAVANQDPSEVIPAIYAETNYAIGMLYWLGQGVTKDYFEASKWMHKAAELGSAGAQGKLGYMYTEGLTVPKDYVQAFYWFSKAAKQGDIDGQYNLGIFYLNGWGTAQDHTMAAQYLGAASAQGDEAADTALKGLLTPGHSREGDPRIREDDALTEQQRRPSPEDEAPAEKRHRHSRAGGNLQQSPIISTQNPIPPPQQDQGDPRVRGNDVDPPLLQPSWILTQNPDRYTIQVIGLSEFTRLEKLIQGHAELAPFATFTQHQNNRPLYMLIQGNYPGVATAREVRDRIPASIQKPGRFWIRPFSEIQNLIRAQQKKIDQ